MKREGMSQLGSWIVMAREYGRRFRDALAAIRPNGCEGCTDKRKDDDGTEEER